MVGSSIYKSFTVLQWHFGLSLKGPLHDAQRFDVAQQNYGWVELKETYPCYVDRVVGDIVEQ